MVHRFTLLGMSDEVLELRETVSAEVRALMGRHRVTQVALAEAVGMTQSSLSRCLASKRAFDLDELLAIARYFNLPISRLIEISPENCWTETGQLAFDFDSDAVVQSRNDVLHVVAA